MMVEKELALLFLNKVVSVVRVENDTGKRMFSRGRLLKVTDNSLVLEFHGALQVISLNAVENLREEQGCPP